MNFWDILWTIVVVYFWFMLIWIFIRIFADIFHRRDLSGGWKVAWTIVLFVLPFLGALVYMLLRKPTDQDREDMAEAQAMQRRMVGYSSADEIAKLQQLKESGALTQEEFDAAKARALG
jgi:hypothetical protein